MDNTAISDINRSSPTVYKQLWTCSDKHLVIIDKSIIEKLGITEDSLVFLEQEITYEKTILMRIKNLSDVNDKRKKESIR